MPTLPLDVATVLAKIAALVSQVWTKKKKKKTLELEKLRKKPAGTSEVHESRSRIPSHWSCPLKDGKFHTRAPTAHPAPGITCYPFELTGTREC